MIKCTHCGGEVSRHGADMTCPGCGRRFRVGDGIYSFHTPRAGHEHKGYSENYFKVNYAIERKHFWFASRNSFVMRLCRRYAPPDGRFMEIGCGTGNVLELLDKNGWRVDGSDVSITALEFARSRVSTDFFQADVCDLPFSEEYDAAILTDVIEHIDDDGLAIENVRKSLKPGGVVFFTVPAVSGLFGAYDRLLYHRRRYDLAPLLTLLNSSGFVVLKATYFNFFLYPLLYLNRRMRRPPDADSPEEDGYLLQKELRIIPGINGLFRFITFIEEILAMRINLPIGGSIAVVARRSE